MSSRGALGLLARAAGVVAGVLGTAAVAAAVLVALGVPSEGRADEPAAISPPVPAAPRPTELVVALDLADPVLQAGVVRDGEVLFARGLEVDIARSLARRLKVPRVRFVYIRPASRLLAAGSSWNVGLASISPSRAAASVADLSAPYLGTDQAVIARRDLPRLTTLAGLRRLVTCARRGSAGAGALAGVVRPTRRPVLAASDERLLELVQTGVCDAGLVDAASAGRLVVGRGALFGPVTARVEFGRGYVVAVTRGGPFPLADVEKALGRMRQDGTLHALARTWLGIDPSRLLPLR